MKSPSVIAGLLIGVASLAHFACSEGTSDRAAETVRQRARERFLEAPHEFCGRVTDPVTRVRFVPETDSPRREHAGRVFLFASASTRRLMTTPRPC